METYESVEDYYLQEDGCDEFILERTVREDRGFHSACWIWVKRKNRTGYGTFGSRLAHRLSYEAFVGPIPSGMNINHHCDQRACVNPDHLYAGTQTQNYADMRERGRWHPLPSLTHCQRGHELTKENTYVYPNGRRNCRECKRMRERERRSGRS